MTDSEADRPTDVTDTRGRFDVFADRASNLAARPAFFAGLVVLSLVWLALGPVTGFSHGWLDLLQVICAVVTLLMVALLENEQWRTSNSTQRKLNAIAEALAHLMERDDTAPEEVEQLHSAVGLEKRESITD